MNAAEHREVFLRALFAGLPGLIELRSFDGRGIARRTFNTTIEEALEAIDRDVRGGMNVYVGVATRGEKRGESGKRSGGKDNLLAVRGWFIDKDGLVTAEAREQYEDTLKCFPCSPSLRVDSGGGEHSYWLAESYLALDTPERMAAFEHILKGLADALGGDPAATDASRIMRVPGTFNLPTPEKLARGRVKSKCRLISHGGPTYSPEDLDLFRMRGEALKPEATTVGTNTAGAIFAPGERHGALKRHAAFLRKSGLSEQAALAALSVFNQERCDPPLPEEEVESLGQWAAQIEPGERNAHEADNPGAFASFTPFTPSSLDAPPWPEPLGEAAFYGLGGEFVGLIERHTEADPGALLIQFLVGFGNLIGRGPHFQAEADLHYTNLFVGIVGETAKGRKGTAWGHVERRLHALAETWATNRIQSGLSSGEGLIWAVRDEIWKQEPVREKRRVIDYQEVKIDDGEADKRLLDIEQELASTLRVLGRDGNTLSATIRQAWESGNLRTLTKNSPAKATGAHISIIGHITRDELRRYLDRTEAGNGFANRFLWVCSRRSKVLPEGGQIGAIDFGPLLRRLSAAFEASRGTGQLKRDEQARELWFQVYEPLSEGRPGLVGAVTSRGEAQVMRLATIYALLDSSKQIRREHLEAALEVWRYAEDSARHVFGNAIGDPKADEALACLRAAPAGLTRDELGKRLFGKHNRAEGLNRVLELLRANGLAYSRGQKTEGRTAEKWFAHRGAKGVYGVKGADPSPSEEASTPFTPFAPSSDGTETAVEEGLL